MKCFVIVLTQENTLRFRLMRKEHGLLHDKKHQQSYAIVRDAYQTNWRGRFGVAYFVRELDAQSVNIDSAAPTSAAGTVAFDPVVRMRTKVKVPGTADDAEVHLSAESIFDKVLSLQVRRMSNRRYSMMMGALLMCTGVVMGLAGGAAITATLMAGKGDQVETTPVVIQPQPADGNVPQSGPETGGASPTIVVQRPREAQPTDGGGG